MIGSERGELASSQDERSWLKRTESRRDEHCTPTIVRPTIDKLVYAGILPEPIGGIDEYEVKWPPLLTLGEKEESEISKNRIELATKYAESPSMQVLIPQEVFYEKYLKWSDKEVDKVMKMIDGINGGMNFDENE